MSKIVRVFLLPHGLRSLAFVLGAKAFPKLRKKKKKKLTRWCDADLQRKGFIPEQKGGELYNYPAF